MSLFSVDVSSEEITTADGTSQFVSVPPYEKAVWSLEQPGCLGSDKCWPLSKAGM